MTSDQSQPSRDAIDARQESGPHKSAAQPKQSTDDIKKKFREALAHKAAHEGPDVGNHDQRGKGMHGQGPAGGKREFRRKTG